jgi:transcriptional regulator with XRE-family HTH domain
MSVGGPDPAIHRRRLRTELRNAREAANMTQRDVAAAMEWSQSKLIRIESGAVNISTNDLRALLAHYGVDSSRIDVLLAVGRAAREVTRWSHYKNVAAPEYMAFLGYESSASIIRNFEPLWVPGLLQTEEYARTVISIIGTHDPARIDSFVDLRIERQELLVRNPGPSFHFIMDEAVIRRLTGGRDVMRGQLGHLLQLAEQQNITIRVVPFDHGVYRLQGVAYQVFEFSDPQDEYVLYIEMPHGQQIVRESSSEQVDIDSPVHYLQAFWELEQITSKEDSLKLIQDVAARLTSDPCSPVSDDDVVGSQTVT